MKRIFFQFLFLLLCLQAFSQTKTFDLTELFTNPDLYPERMSQLKWLPESNRFSFVDTNDVLIVESVKSKDALQRKFIDLETLAGYLPDSVGKLNRMPFINWKTDRTFYFNKGGIVWTYTDGNDSLRPRGIYDLSGANLDVTRTYNTAFTIDHNLYVGIAKEKEIVQVTQDGSEDIVYAEAASRSEFGITKGTFWSPDGSKLAFYRIDQSLVSGFPLVDYSTIPAKPKTIKYPMAGDSSQHVTVGVYDTKTNKTIYLKTGKNSDHYLTNITWSPDGNYIFIAVVNRGQNKMDLNQYDAASGIFIKTLFTETDEQYVEPEHGPVFLKKDKSKFLWFSERDGFNHLYLYDTDGNMIKQVTKGQWEVTELLGTDLKEKYVFITSTKATPIERHPYRVSLKDGEMLKLTEFAGYHRSQLSYDGNYLLDSYTRKDVPGFTKLRNTKKGEKIRTLFKSSNPLENHSLGEISIFKIAGTNGDSLFCRLIKPVNFDASKKYPVMVYLYGGPHYQVVRNSWLGGAQLFLQYMAQQGFVVFSLDNHGSPARGIDFEQIIHRQMGTVEMKDQLKGVQWLKKQKWVDDDRIGVFGWSYGGFMSSSLMLRNPGVFKVAVAGGPVTNWRMYEVMYGERYMDTPQENPEGYDNNNVSNYVKNLEGKLLIIHGTQDDVVVPQHSMNLLRKSVQEGVQIDFFTYPSHPHNVRGRDRGHLLEKISRYFMNYL
jgi:dipeptidyl-peptidase 4